MRIIRPDRNKLYHSAVNPTLSIAAGGTSWLVDEFWMEPKELEFLDYEEDLTARFDALQQSQQIDSSSISYARSKGVENEWEMMNFFSNEDIKIAQNLLQYVDNNGELASFTPDDLELIRSWSPGEPYPVKGLEGHHIQTIRDNPNDIQLASDSDNIILATKYAHYKHLHGGHTANSTQESYMNIKMSNKERLTELLVHKEDDIVPGFFEHMLVTTSSSILIGVTIGQIITLYQLKKENHPWKEKRKILAASALFSSLVSGAAGITAFASKSLIDSHLNDLSMGSIDIFFNEMIGPLGSILAAQLVIATINSILAFHRSRNFKQALLQFNDAMVTAVAEFAVFSLIGIGLEIGTDQLGGLLVDALIPDPTGILIALRVGYSTVKIGTKFYSARKNQQAYLKCSFIRQLHYYNSAKNAIQ